MLNEKYLLFLQEEQICLDIDIYIPLNPPGVENNIIFSEELSSVSTNDDVDSDDAIVTKEVSNNGEPLGKKRKMVLMLTDESISI